MTRNFEPVLERISDAIVEVQRAYDNHRPGEDRERLYAARAALQQAENLVLFLTLPKVGG